MKKFFANKDKIILMIYGILGFIIILSALAFMTQYRYIHLNYERSPEGVISYSQESAMNGAPQQTLFFLLADITDGLYDGATAPIFESLKGICTWNDSYTISTIVQEKGDLIYNFKLQLDNFNTLIVWFGLATVIAFALMLVFGNHNRKVYYISNLISGILLPLCVIVFGAVMIVLNVGLIAQFNENSDLFNLVSVCQNTNNGDIVRIADDFTNAGNIEALNAAYANFVNAFDCDITTFIVYIALFSVIVAYSLFIIVWTVIRYKGSAKRRNEILERAGVINND